MTAIIAPTTYRNGWSSGSHININNMGSEGDGSRIFVPRKSTQRSNSSSSLASSTSSTSSASSTSSTSSTSTIPHSSGLPNGVANGDGNHATINAARKKPSRGIWNASKAEPVSGLSDARSQPVATNSSGQSAASAMSALRNPASQQTQPSSQAQSPAIGIARTHTPSEPRMLQLQPLNGTFERKTIIVPTAPDILRVGRQTNQKTLPTPSNGYFDSKVLSRQHAEIWSDNEGKIWIRDVKSSNGTFVNSKRLSPENRDSEPHLLKYDDHLELGIDIISEDQKTVVHHKVDARVEHAGPHAPVNNGPDLGGMNDIDLLPGSRLLPKGQYSAQNQGTNNARHNPAGAAVANVPPAPYHPKWLQPVSMELIVKRLNVELKNARRQNSNLSSSVNMVTSRSVEQRPVSASAEIAPLLPTKSIDDIKARFSTAAPAHIPLRPLPDGPLDALARDEAVESSSVPPILRRSDTERPIHIITSMSANSSPVRMESSSQILNLVEQLSTAQKEIAAQGQRLKDMETVLNTEREGRRSAEERAARLESTSAALPNGASVRENTDSGIDFDLDPNKVNQILGADLQQRIELMKMEMDGMKLQMEQYRQRTSAAEQESTRDRRTLAAMVESIRRREEAATRRKAQKSRTWDSASTSKSMEEADEEVQALDDKLNGEIRHAEEILHESSTNANGTAMNGSAKGPMSVSELQQLGKAAIAAVMGSGPQHSQSGHQHMADTVNGQTAIAHTHRSTRQEQLVQSAPYASLLGVVLLGVGMMAYLNGWQKVTET